MLLSKHGETVLEQIVTDLAQMRCPNLSGTIGTVAVAILMQFFLGSKIMPEFLKVLQRRVWLASWGTVTIEEVPPEEWLPFIKGPAAYLCLVSFDGNQKIRFTLGPYRKPVKFYEQS